MTQKGWHSRGYLPHYDGPEVAQHIVFRLHDALPPDAPDSGDDILDRGHGCAVLAQKECADVVARVLLFHSPERYALSTWCVMPNHVHVLIVTRVADPLGTIVKSWKANSAVQINALLKRRGRLWAPDYFDRFMRDQAHFETTKRYIEMNPVAAGLCRTPEDWLHSSVGWK